MVNDIPEVSLTEVVQESVLAVIVLVHFLLARNYSHLRYSISSSAASSSPC